MGSSEKLRNTYASISATYKAKLRAQYDEKIAYKWFNSETLGEQVSAAK